MRAGIQYEGSYFANLYAFVSGPRIFARKRARPGKWAPVTIKMCEHRSPLRGGILRFSKLVCEASERPAFKRTHLKD
jgi:hypothetical protein